MYYSIKYSTPMLKAQQIPNNPFRFPGTSQIPVVMMQSTEIYTQENNNILLVKSWLLFPNQQPDLHHEVLSAPFISAQVTEFSKE